MLARRILPVILAGIVLLGGAAHSAALDGDVIVRGVEVGGQTHLVQYPTSDAATADVVAQALQTIVPKDEWLWDRAPNEQPANQTMDFQILIEIGVDENMGEDASAVAVEPVDLPLPSYPDPWGGETQGAPTTVCHIQFSSYSTLYTFPQEVRFELALDLARCYVSLYADASGDQGEWLSEGLAYWQAIQAFDPPAAVLARLQKDYEDGYNSNLLNTSGEAMYFWEYLFGSSSSGVNDLTLPTSPGGLNALPNLILMLNKDTFFEYAQVVAREALAWQPSVDALADGENLFRLPEDVELGLEVNSIALTQVGMPELAPLEPGQGVSIVATHLTDNGVRLALAQGGAMLEMTEGTPVQLCTDQIGDALLFVAGRGPEQALTQNPSLSFTRIDECHKKGEEPVLPSCIVGTWNITLPDGGTMAIGGGRYQFTANADGTVSWVAEDLDMRVGNMSGIFNMSMVGHMTLTPVSGGENRYQVATFEQQLAPGTTATVEMGGQTMDLTESLQSPSGGEAGMGINPAFVTCQQAGAHNPRVDFLVANTAALGDILMSLTRVP